MFFDFIFNSLSGFLVSVFVLSFIDYFFFDCSL